MKRDANVLVLGASGMLGHAVLRVLARNENLSVAGTVRSPRAASLLPPEIRERIIGGVDVENVDGLLEVFGRVRPTVVINCVGLVKQLDDAADPLLVLPINALLPHRLALLCSAVGARFVHVSTDCVFSGNRGDYHEDDPSDAGDLYGKSKYIGEVTGPGLLTLRTSIIGHELGTRHGLVEWFLSQHGEVRGYERAVFSGLPTVELATVIRDHVLPNPALTGIYHVAAKPINKYDLLQLIAAEYGSASRILRDDRVRIDRSLNGERFKRATGYESAPWPELVHRMRAFH